jgi:hypothetical protein
MDHVGKDTLGTRIVRDIVISMHRIPRKEQRIPLLIDRDILERVEKAEDLSDGKGKEFSRAPEVEAILYDAKSALQRLYSLTEPQAFHAIRLQSSRLRLRIEQTAAYILERAR